MQKLRSRMNKSKIVALGIAVALAVAAYLVSRWTSSQEVQRAPTETAVQEVMPVPAGSATSIAEGGGAVQQQPPRSSVAEPSDAKGEKERQMPLANLLEYASEKWGFQFDDFYKYRVGREEWSLWEQTVNQHIEDYLLTTKTWSKDAQDVKTRHFMHRYKLLWERGVLLADAPMPAELEPTDSRWDPRVWDDDLGEWRPIEDPTIYVDASRIHWSKDGSFSGVNIARSVNGAPSLTGDDFYRLLKRGVAPEGVKLIYIDQDGQELPPGERPKELDPSEAFKDLSDEELRRHADLYEHWMTPEYEPRYLEIVKDPSLRLRLENAAFSFMSAWRERPSAWVPPASSTGAAPCPP